MISGIGSYSISHVAGLDGSTRSDTRKHGGDSGRRGAAAANTDATGLKLSPEAQKAVNELQQRDQEVRSHEQAHKSVGGSLAGSASYTTTKGPDNRHYAVGGEVSIDTAPVHGDPEATAEKARQIRSAAMAPASPSAQDMHVASQAAQMESKARMEKASAAYKRMSGETGLAPWGTGISFSV